MNVRNVATVPPLTSTKRDGTPYTRRADVTEAIALALSLPKDHWAECAAQSDAARLPSEALVFLLRSLQSTERELIGQLAWQLLVRIETIAKRWAKGFDSSTTEEIVETVQQKMVDLTLKASPSRQRDFLEVAFSQAVKHHTLKAVEKRRNAPLPLTAQQHAAIDGENEDAERPTELVADDSPEPDELVLALQDKQRRGPLLRLAQRAVKDLRHYEALFLHFGFDWQISSKDPTTETLQTFFGVSERQIRNWIRDGLKAIRKSLEKHS